MSVGNLDLAHRIYRDAQRLVIGSGDESITCAVLEQAYISACGLSSRTEEVKELRKSNYMPSRKHKNRSNDVSAGRSKSVRPKKVIWDISKPQHLEFEDKLLRLMAEDDLPSIITKPNLMRSTEDEPDKKHYLREQGFLCEYPLEQFM